MQSKNVIIVVLSMFLCFDAMVGAEDSRSTAQAVIQRLDDLIQKGEKLLSSIKQIVLQAPTFKHEEGDLTAMLTTCYEHRNKIESSIQNGSVVNYGNINDSIYWLEKRYESLVEKVRNILVVIIQQGIQDFRSISQDALNLKKEIENNSIFKYEVRQLHRIIQVCNHQIEYFTTKLNSKTADLSSLIPKLINSIKDLDNSYKHCLNIVRQAQNSGADAISSAELQQLEQQDQQLEQEADLVQSADQAQAEVVQEASQVELEKRNSGEDRPVVGGLEEDDFDKPSDQSPDDFSPATSNVASQATQQPLTQEFMNEVVKKSHGWFVQLPNKTGMISLAAVKKLVQDAKYSSDEMLYIQGFLQAMAL